MHKGILVRVTDEMLAWLEFNAQQQDISVPEFIRRIITVERERQNKRPFSFTQHVKQLAVQNG